MKTGQTEVLHFSYQSIGNICKLLVTILFEKQKTEREISVFHQRFDSYKADELFEQFLTELYPEGVTVGEQEINRLVEYVAHFMEKDERCKDLFVEYDKAICDSYVYFIPDKIVIPAPMGSHCEIVQNLCIDYFKGFKTIEFDYLKKFLRENFEIKSRFTDIDTVVADARRIKSMIDCFC